MNNPFHFLFWKNSKTDDISKGLYNVSRTIATGFLLSCSKLYYLLIYSVIKGKKSNKASLASFVSNLREQSDKYLKENRQFLDNPGADSSFCLNLLAQMRMIIQEEENIFKSVDSYLNDGLIANTPILQIKEFKALNDSMSIYFNFVVHLLRSNKFDDYDELTFKEKFLSEKIEKLQRKQLKMSKKEEISLNQCMFSISLMEQSKMLLQDTGKLIAEIKQFAEQTQKEEMTE